MIITTSNKPSLHAVNQATRLAEELPARYMNRRNLSLKQLLGRAQTKQMFVVTEQELRYYEENAESPMFFHPSMAYVRVKRLRRGDADPMIELSGCSPGDSVIDCTAGLGSDALVFSYAAGPSGQVTAIESEQVVFTLVREGLQQYQTDLEDVNEAMRRITMRCEHHESYLRSLPDKSVDIVYFDPMFREPIQQSSSIEPLRAMANHRPLDPSSVEQAMRVARKSILLKEHRDSGEFQRLGFERRHVNTSKIAYGVIKLDHA
ncbi:class I SAM-dependent methyltransferase [Paenibacillus sp. GCM10023252]|uniref:class I SAM-dependent methyltransferase n=1 Tax=Paenibacillus sp. GCM10023252 TaxID=3252649 RepID=UPI0036120A3E